MTDKKFGQFGKNEAQNEDAEKKSTILKAKEAIVQLAKIAIDAHNNKNVALSGKSKELFATEISIFEKICDTDKNFYSALAEVQNEMTEYDSKAWHWLIDDESIDWIFNDYVPF